MEGALRTSVKRKRRSGASAAERERKPLAVSEYVLTLGAGGLIYAGHYFYGALISDVVLVIGMGFALLAGFILSLPKLRADLARPRGLVWPAATFAVTVAIALLTLTPHLPGGPNPIWDYVGLGTPAVTVDKSSTTVEIIKLGILACVFLVGLVVGGSERRARYGLFVLLALGAVLGVWAFFGAVAGFIPQTQGHRLEGHFLNPNTAGAVFASLLILALALVAEALEQARAGKRSTIIGCGVAIGLIFLVCLLMTGSRGAMLALLGALTFFGISKFLVSGRRLSRGAYVGFSVALIGVAAVYFAGDMVAERFLNTNADIVVRSAIWAEHWRAFKAAPLFGYGLGTSETVNQTLISAGTFRRLWNISAILNVYLQWLEQAGVVGASMMFLTLAIIIVSTFVGFLRRSRMRMVLLALLGVDIIFLIHGASDFALETPSVAMFWAYLLGLQFALAASGDRSTAPVRQGFVTAVAGAGAAVIFLAALMSMVALNRGGAAYAGPLKLELAGGYNRRALSVLSGKMDKAGAARVISDSRRALALYPYDTGAWLHIAEADGLANNGLSREGLAALQRSYDLAMIAPAQANWRIRFCLEYWPWMTPELRKAVQKEVEVLAASPRHRRLVGANLRSVADPSGRLTALVWLSQIRREGPQTPSGARKTAKSKNYTP